MATPAPTAGGSSSLRSHRARHANGDTRSHAINVDDLPSDISDSEETVDDDIITVRSTRAPRSSDDFVVQAVRRAGAPDLTAPSAEHDDAAEASSAHASTSAAHAPDTSHASTSIARAADRPATTQIDQNVSSSSNGAHRSHRGSPAPPLPLQAQAGAPVPDYAAAGGGNTWWDGVRQTLPNLYQYRHLLFAPASQNMPQAQAHAGPSRAPAFGTPFAGIRDNDEEKEDSDDDRAYSDAGDSAGMQLQDAELGLPPQDSIAGENMAAMLAEMASGSFRGHDALGQLYDGDRGFNVATLPLYPATSELKKRGLKTPLHRHQLQGLLWMIQAEHRRHKVDKRAALWHTAKLPDNQLAYRNVATGQTRRLPPTLPRGGINADAMGLGKTLQVIALGLSDRRKAPKGIPVRAHEKGDDSDASLASSYCSSRDSEDSGADHSSTDDDSSDSDTADSSEDTSPPRKLSKISPKVEGSSRVGKQHTAPQRKVGRDKNAKSAVDGKERDEVRSPTPKDAKYNNTTLVICPLSVLQNWAKQVADHCDQKAVHYLTYYGADAKALRGGSTFSRIFAKKNFVFTTYDTVRAEYALIEKRRQWESESEARRKKRRAEYEATAQRTQSCAFPEDNAEDESFLFEDIDMMPLGLSGETPLFATAWRRVVLDEAHVVRNSTTTIYRAICELYSERRWAITGTPIVNSTRDLGALAAWVGLEPFEPTDMKIWTKLIEKPLKKAETAQRAAGLVRAVVQSCQKSLCLRRHKGMTDADGAPIVKLPQIRYYQHTIALTEADRDFYQKCEKACQRIIARWVSENELHNHHGIVLLFLLRLRQMSCHRQLIGPQLLEELQTTDWDTFDARSQNGTGAVVLDAEKVKKLREQLKVLVEMGDECPVCMEPLADRGPLMTPCAHAFCRECIVAVIMNSQTTQQGPRCPMDRLALPRDASQLIELPKEEPKADDDAREWEHDSHTSAKVRECLRIVQGTLSTDATEKILVFSNFVKFLDIIADELEELGFAFARYNGAMNVQRRDAVLERFNEPISDVHAEATRAAVKRYQQRVEMEKSAAEAKGASSSRLLSALQRVDWNASRQGLATSSTSARKRSRGNNDTHDVVGKCPSILLISMGCGALGLNLTAASTVVLMDPWWQSTIEQQAIDRVHRIGQRRDIKVFQMVCKDTVEERVLQIQKQKEDLAEQAFSGIRTGHGTTSDRRQKTLTSVRDLARLFGLSERQVTALESQRQSQNA